MRRVGVNDATIPLSATGPMGEPLTPPKGAVLTPGTAPPMLPPMAAPAAPRMRVVMGSP